MHIFNCSQHRLAGIAITFVLIVPQLVLADTDNTVYGIDTMPLNSSGSYDNCAFGNSALHNTTHGINKTAIGASSLFSIDGDSNDTAVGVNALYSYRFIDFMQSESYNTAGGVNALYVGYRGNDNTAIGVNALYSNTANYNTAIGVNVLSFNTTGHENTASGVSALYYNTNGYANTAIGTAAMELNDSGWGNTASGFHALYNNLSGHNNVAVGFNAGYELKGDNNIAIGHVGDAGDNNTTRIGDGQNRAFIAGISGVRASGGVQVYINSAGQLGTTTSSERFKKEIKSIDSVSDKLLQLRPVSFIYKEDDTKELQYGLIAEEVAKVYPELVQYDSEGKPFTVYYHFLTPLLLSEMQKEHAVNEAQQTTLSAGQEKFDEQQDELANLQRQIAAEAAQTLAVLQGQQLKQRRHTNEMAALRVSLNQLDQLVQTGDSSAISSNSLALVPSN